MAEWLVEFCYFIFLDRKKIDIIRPTNFNIHIKEVKLCSGAGFIVVIAGNIMTMPGLSKTPAYLNMDIDNQGNISGLF